MTVEEVVTLVNIALGNTPSSSCGGLNATIGDVIQAVNHLLDVCPGGPTPTASPTVAPTATTPASGDAAGAGLLSTISTAEISAAGEVRVIFSLTDAEGKPISAVLSAAQNPQQARVRLTIAHLEHYSGGGEFNKQFTRYVNDLDAVRPRYDSGGTIEIIDATSGIYRYVFKATIPAAVSRSQTFAVGMQVDRTFEGKQLSANPIFDFVPNGGVAEVRMATTTARCNSCHDPLILHGNRREVRLCSLCHNEAAQDPNGVSIDFRNMIHKIHQGKDLPSIVNGAPGAKYAITGRSESIFAEKKADGSVTGVGFPRTTLDCQVCHADGPTAAAYREQPSVGACVSCHDDVNPSLATTTVGPPGTNHFQSRGFADGDCAFCHTNATDKEFDVSIAGAHTIPERSRQLAGLNIELLGLASHARGETPTISFKVSGNAGSPLPSLAGLNRLAFTIAGPTSDYSRLLLATAVGGGATGTLAGPDGDGIFTYTPAAAIPAAATGTWALGVEARRTVNLSVEEGISPKTVEEAATNSVVTFVVDGSTAEVRRSVVDDAKCGKCHGQFSKDFSIHGNLRNQTEYCVLCHNPTQNDSARRRRDPAAVAAAAETATIDFKVLIHKIHTGEDLNQQPYLIYGFGAAPANYTVNNFGEVRYVGDRRNCSTCHVGTSYLLPPFPGPSLATRRTHLDPATGNEVEIGHTGPITSACTSCHDSDEALAHADTQTASNGGEACLVCHQEGRAEPVSSAHAR